MCPLFRVSRYIAINYCAHINILNGWLGMHYMWTYIFHSCTDEYKGRKGCGQRLTGDWHRGDLWQRDNIPKHTHTRTVIRKRNERLLLTMFTKCYHIVNLHSLRAKPKRCVLLPSMLHMESVFADCGRTQQEVNNQHSFL